MPRKKQLKRAAIHRSLVHHSYSGKLVHHSHTHYPTIVFMMLLCGVLLLAMTTATKAAELRVTATVLGDPPPFAAVITEPRDGQRFSAIPIDIEGTCPPDSIVKIYRNDVFGGSVLCSAGQTFALKSDLFINKNTLIARVFNLAGLEGPVSKPVVVYYDKSAGPGITQLFLDSETLYRSFFTHEKISWPVEIGGGKAPYAVSVDWGDGTSDVISLQKAGKFTISHIYTEPGGYKGSYKISIKASDSQDGTAYLEVVVIVNDIKTATAAPTGRDDSDSLAFWQNLYKRILLMWPFYITAVLMLVSFWLGERQMLNNIFSRGPKSRRAH